MPCRDYETDNVSNYDRREQYKQQCDKLARVACAAMEELIKHGKADFLVLQNEEVREWWTKHQEADRKEREKVSEEERKAHIREEALKRLTEEEKELLGLNKPSVNLDEYVITSDINATIDLSKLTTFTWNNNNLK